jgi:hypothetical protein
VIQRGALALQPPKQWSKVETREDVLVEQKRAFVMDDPSVRRSCFQQLNANFSALGRRKCALSQSRFGHVLQSCILSFLLFSSPWSWSWSSVVRDGIERVGSE